MKPLCQHHNCFIYRWQPPTLRFYFNTKIRQIRIGFQFAGKLRTMLQSILQFTIQYSDHWIIDQSIGLSVFETYRFGIMFQWEMYFLWWIDCHVFIFIPPLTCHLIQRTASTFTFTYCVFFSFELFQVRFTGILQSNLEHGAVYHQTFAGKCNALCVPVFWHLCCFNVQTKLQREWCFWCM